MTTLIDIRWEDVTVRYPNGKITLHLPEAISPDGLTTVKLKRLFRLFIEHRHWVPSNISAMQALEQYLEDYVLACKEASEYTAAYYQRNRQDPAAVEGNTKDARSKRKTIKDQNARLLQQVKQTEKTYQHSQKVKEIWDELKSQYVI